MGKGNEQLAGLEDGPAEAMRILAHLYLCQQHPAKAVVLLEALRELGAESVEVLRPLCQALLLTGRYAEALTVSDELVAKAAAVPSAQQSAVAASTTRLCEARLRAEALWGLGYAGEAQRQLEEVLK